MVISRMSFNFWYYKIKTKKKSCQRENEYRDIKFILLVLWWRSRTKCWSFFHIKCETLNRSWFQRELKYYDLQHRRTKIITIYKCYDLTFKLWIMCTLLQTKRWSFWRIERTPIFRYRFFTNQSVTIDNTKNKNNNHVQILWSEISFVCEM